MRERERKLQPRVLQALTVVYALIFAKFNLFVRILYSVFCKNYKRCYKDFTIVSCYLVLAIRQSEAVRFNVKTKCFVIKLKLDVIKNEIMSCQIHLKVFNSSQEIPSRLRLKIHTVK